jgi:transposase
MELRQSKSGRVRVHRTAEFKSRLIDLASQPGASMAGVAVAHGVNPNLLRRWIRESKMSSVSDWFVPVMIEGMAQTVSQIPVSKEEQSAQRIEVSLQRGDLRVEFKVDPPHMIELGKLLREVLR